MLIARIFDAFIDPAIGLWLDKQRDNNGLRRCITLSLILLVCGFIALFHPPLNNTKQPFVWFLSSLTVVYSGFSLASIAYQTWGAAITQARSQRSRVTAVREACGLIGVIISSALASLADIGWLSFIFVVSLLSTAVLLLRNAPAPDSCLQTGQTRIKGGLLPFKNRLFRYLFGIYMLNGIAAAIPATLFLFFINDRLALPQYAGQFLVVYFSMAALSMPIWVALAKHYGEKVAWLISMGLSIAVFGWATTLTSGSATGFAVICIFSGISLGADLALPPSLLAAIIRKAGDMGIYEGAYFGLWNWATKMSLALAAGISLPLLELMGYVPGTTDVQGLHALALAYALLPCVLKFISAMLLWNAPLGDL